MSKILRTTFASAFAIASIAGASLAFAADNGGKTSNANSSSKSQTTGKKAKDNKCAAGDKTKPKDMKANCTK